MENPDAPSGAFRFAAGLAQQVDGGEYAVYCVTCQMQPLPHTTDLGGTVATDCHRCAAQVLDALPPMMRFVRKHMRSHKLPALSVPAFRVLCLLRTAPEANLSAVSDFLGASLPTASRIVATLVNRKLVMRKACAGDRRQVRLSLTPRGAAALEKSREETTRRLCEVLSGIDADELKTVSAAFARLAELFVPGLIAAD